MTSLNLFLAVVGCLMYSTALHLKQPGKDIEYGSFGFAQNLTGTGRAVFFVGLVLAIVSFAL